MKRVAIALAAGIFYILVYCFLAILFVPFDFTGPRRYGTGVFFAPVATFPLVYVALYLVGRLTNQARRVAFVILLLLHYAITFFLVTGYFREPGEWQITLNTIDEAQTGFMLITAWYLLGQSFLWYSFFRTFRPNNSLH
jgi:hypothetical protein